MAFVRPAGLRCSRRRFCRDAAGTIDRSLGGQLLLNSNWRFMEADFGATGLADAKVDLPQERRDFAEFSIDGAVRALDAS
jgi:hypothetical protein